MVGPATNRWLKCFLLFTGRHYCKQALPLWLVVRCLLFWLCMFTVILLFLVSFTRINHSHVIILYCSSGVSCIIYVCMPLEFLRLRPDNTILTRESEWVQCVMWKGDKKPLNNCLVHSWMCCVCSGVRETPLEWHWTVPLRVEIPCKEGDGVIPTQRRLMWTWSKLCCELHWRPLAHSTQINGRYL